MAEDIGRTRSGTLAAGHGWKGRLQRIGQHHHHHHVDRPHKEKIGQASMPWLAGVDPGPCAHAGSSGLSQVPGLARRAGGEALNWPFGARSYRQAGQIRGLHAKSDMEGGGRGVAFGCPRPVIDVGVR